MSKIRIMSEQMSNRIAAGEVIERPASVVKELVENAIDAGATKVRIEIERAGTRLIKVVDDGHGMDADDALLALEPHGTSKILTEDDIDHITTLGFRGEALPSIAAVSHLVLQTRQKGVLEGTVVKVDGGKFIDCAPSGGPAGTSITVGELFYNTPARKKFMKSEATEMHHIEEMVLLLALPYPQIGFTLLSDGRKVFESPGAPDLAGRLQTFFGKEFAAQMLAVDYRQENLHLTGFVAGPGLTRNSRKEQRTFVNHRAVESPAIYRGLRDGYATLAERGRYSPCVLFCEMPPEDLDVNVHPTKREVRFKQEFVLSRAVALAVGRALQNTPKPEGTYFAELSGKVSLKNVLDGATTNYTVKTMEQPTLLTDQLESEQADDDKLFMDNLPDAKTDSASLPHAAVDKSAFADLAARQLAAVIMPPSVVPEAQKDTELTDEAVANYQTIGAVAPAKIPEIPVDLDFSKRGDRSYQVEFPDEILGIYDDTYILCQGRDGLILIDQHAAHERVMFEKLLSDCGKQSPSQPLLLPQVLELPRNSAALLLRNRQTFAQLGFDIEPLGSNTVMLNALPLALPTDQVGSLLQDMLQELLDNDTTQSQVELAYIARAACKAAIKAHDHITIDGAKILLKAMRQCRQGTLCPHGRPTMLNITKGEIERRFGRK